MRTYTITDPSGKVHTIDGPEGATREQVIAKIQERLAAAPKEDPYTATAQKQSGLENALAGAGGAIHGLYLGAKQMLGKATPEEIEDHRRAMEGLRSTTAGKVGEFGGNVAAGAIPGLLAAPVAATYAGSAAIGAGLGALQPTQGDESRLNNAALGAFGGAAGNAIGRGISRVIQPIPRMANSGRDKGIAAAQRLGIGDQLTPGQKTGNLALQQVEAVLSRTPGAAGRFDIIKDTHQAALNRAAAKSIGEDAIDLSGDVIARASDRISKQFNDLSAKSDLQLDEDFMKLVNKLKSNNDMLGPFRNPQIDSLIEKSYALAQMKNIPGNVYQTIRSELTSNADDAFRSGNSSAGRALKDIRDALDDSAKKGLSEVDQKAWDVTRKEYANLMILLKGKTIKGGNVDQNLINNAMIKYNNKLYQSDLLNGELNDIGKYAQAFKTTVPNSGTPERTFMQNMMFGNPLTGIPTAALANLYQRAYLAKPIQAYLSSGIANLPPSVQRMLLLSGGLGGAALGSNANQ